MHISKHASDPAVAPYPFPSLHLSKQMEILVCGQRAIIKNEALGTISCALHL